jgi:hypothetical protein
MYEPEKNIIDKSLLFQNFFKIMEDSSRRNPEKGTSIDLSDYERVSRNNYFGQASISFKLDFKKYTSNINKWTSILFKIPFFVEHMKDNYNLDKYMPDLEKSRGKEGEFNFSYNEATREFLMVLNKAFAVKTFHEDIKKYYKENKIYMLDNVSNGRNLKYIFCLSDNFGAVELKHENEITKTIVKDSILTMKADFHKLTIYVGSNKFADTVFSQELDFQNQNTILRENQEELLKIEQIYVYLNIDMKKNMLKVILFLNDMRKDFEFKFTHKTDYIAYFSGVFVNPSVEDLIMNVGENSLSKHLNQIRNKITIKFKKKFCTNFCTNCFVGSKKYLTKCLVCSEGKSMYNNYCMKAKNVAVHPILRKIQNRNFKKNNHIKNRN